MPSYNAYKYLQEAVESVCVQTFQEWELIILDDGSVDKTATLASDLVKHHHGKVRFVQSRHSGTPSIGRNIAISIAKGDMIVPLDDDDTLQPNSLELYYNEMMKNPDIDVVVGYNKMFGNLSVIDMLHVKHITKCEPYDKLKMLKRNLIMNTCMFRRSLWQQVGGYSVLAPAAEDWFFWWIVEQYKPLNVKCIDKITLNYRQKGNSRNSASMKSGTHVYAALKLLAPNLFSFNELMDAVEQLKVPNALIMSHVNSLIKNYPYLSIPYYWKALQMEGMGKLGSSKQLLNVALKTSIDDNLKWLIDLYYGDVLRKLGEGRSCLYYRKAHSKRPEIATLPQFEDKNTTLVAKSRTYTKQNENGWLFGLQNKNTFVPMDLFGPDAFWRSSEFGGVLHFQDISHPSYMYPAVRLWKNTVETRNFIITGSVRHIGKGGDGVNIEIHAAGNPIIKSYLNQSSLNVNNLEIILPPGSYLELITLSRQSDAYDSTSWNLSIYSYRIKDSCVPQNKKSQRMKFLIEAARTWSILGDLWIEMDTFKATELLVVAYDFITRMKLLNFNLHENLLHNLANTVAHSLFRLGMLHIKNKSYEKAVELFQLSICAGQFPYSYLGASLAFFLLDKKDEAVHYFKTATQLKPSVVDVVFRSPKFGVFSSLRQDSNDLKVIVSKIEKFAIRQNTGNKFSTTCTVTQQLPFVGKRLRKLAVVYAHNAVSHGARLGPQGTFETDMNMLYYGFVSLGYDVVKGSLQDCYDANTDYFNLCWSRQLIVFAPIFLSQDNPLESYLPNGTVLVQQEQITADENTWVSKFYLNTLKNPKYVIWDYSLSNSKYLKKYGVENVHMLPFGYSPQMSNVVTVPTKDIDVIFFGLMHPRRFKILNALKRLGYICVFLEGIYMGERDQFISRAKVALNIHYYSSKVTESNRILSLLMHQILIISEKGAKSENDKLWEDAGVVFVSYDNIIATVVQYLKNPGMREENISKAIPALMKTNYQSKLSKLVEAFNLDCLHDAWCTVY